MCGIVEYIPGGVIGREYRLDTQTTVHCPMATAFTCDRHYESLSWLDQQNDSSVKKPNVCREKQCLTVHNRSHTMSIHSEDEREEVLERSTSDPGRWPCPLQLEHILISLLLSPWFWIIFLWYIFRVRNQIWKEMFMNWHQQFKHLLLFGFAYISCSHFFKYRPWSIIRLCDNHSVHALLHIFYLVWNYCKSWKFLPLLHIWSE